MKYEEKTLLLEKKSLEYWWLKHYKSKLERAKELEVQVTKIDDSDFNLEEFGVEDTELDLEELNHLNVTEEDKQSVIDDSTLLKKKSIEYLIAKKIGIIDDGKEEKDELSRIISTEKNESDEYKKWGEVQFDGKGVDPNEVRKRMIGFSKDSIRKVNVD